MSKTHCRLLSALVILTLCRAGLAQPPIGSWGDQGDGTYRNPGFYCWNNKRAEGHIDIDYFQYDYNGPKGP